MQKYLKILGILFEERDRLEKKRMRINPYKAGSDEKIKKLDVLIKENNQLIDQFEKIVKLFLDSQDAYTREIIQKHYYEGTRWNAISGNTDVGESTTRMHITRACDAWDYKK